MKKLKLSEQQLENGDILSRDQLKDIMGGAGKASPNVTCSVGTSCSVLDNGTTYLGSCGYLDLGGGVYYCECITADGAYVPSGTQSHCNV